MYKHTLYIGMAAGIAWGKVAEALQRYDIEAMTVYEANGVYKGEIEGCFVVDIVNDLTPDRIRFIAHMIGAELKQKEILVVSALVLSHIEKCQPVDTGIDRLKKQA